MAATISINLSKAISSINIVGQKNEQQDPQSATSNTPSPDFIAEQEKVLSELDTQKNEVEQLYQTFQQLIVELEQFYNKQLAENRKEIAKLSVEIARKVLAQKVKDGDYEIESIIEQALENIDTSQNLTIHLNPNDLEKVKAIQQNDSDAMLNNLKLLPDPNLGDAECVVDTPNGTVEAIISKHLEEISKALDQTE